MNGSWTWSTTYRQCRVSFVVLGTVDDTPDRRHTRVKFDSDQLGRLEVPARYVLPSAGAVARPSLSVCTTHS